MNDLIWIAVRRDELLGLLMGVERSLNYTVHQHPVESEGVDVWLGYAGGSTHPGLAIVNPTDSKEVFAWLDAFSEESFPVSQFLRVASWEEWKTILKENDECREVHTVNSVWPSIICAELLGQGDVGADLTNIPYSRTAACFSHSVGRSKMLYRDGAAVVDECISRLRALESSTAFPRRTLAVATLEPMWKLALSWLSEPNWNDEPSKVVLRIVETSLEQADDPTSGHARNLWAAELNGLLSSSAEKRVVSFERLAAGFAKVTRSETQNIAALCMAAGAFLVGFGTSHVELLSAYAAINPLCLPWFGLFAGFAGPHSWDKDWTRAAKVIERQIRMPFRPSDPVVADLCWQEFEWLTNGDAHHAFRSIAKLYPRTVTVEVVPGATCQMRLASAATTELPKAQADNVSIATEERVRNMDAMFRDIEAAMSRLRRAVMAPDPRPGSADQSLLFDEGQRESGKRRSYGRAKKKGNS